MQICIHCGSVVTNQSARAGDEGGVVSIMGWKYPLEEEMATHFSILA